MHLVQELNVGTVHGSHFFVNTQSAADTSFVGIKILFTQTQNARDRKHPYFMSNFFFVICSFRVIVYVSKVSLNCSLISTYVFYVHNLPYGTSGKLICF